ncbi:MAG: hypothetical protein Q8P02_00370 [Candidatus Micrarchaeota archaeon]|nr:hypothetical protein [Candidatus Micrarchaeota archaeon]
MRLLPLRQKTLNALQKDDGRMLADVVDRAEVKIVLKDGNAAITGDGGKEWIAEQVLKALDFGFLSRQAFKLLDDRFFLEVIDLEAAFRGDERKVKRYKARVIGQGGAAKKKLQELSGAFLSVGPREVAVLGEFEELRAAKEAVLRLLEGAEHTGVYAYLEREKHKQKRLM